MRRVTESVTGLLPQPTWLVNWLHSSNLKEEEHSESEQPVPSTSSASDRIEEQPRESFIFRRPPVSVSEQGTNGKLSYNFDVKSERFTYLSCMLTGLPPLNLPVGVSGEETSNLDGGISTHEISVQTIGKIITVGYEMQTLTFTKF